MVYKRATAQLQAAGIENIVITKGHWGAVPHDTRAEKQTAKCFSTWKEAVEAVIGGYRPEIIRFKLEFAYEDYLDRLADGSFFRTEPPRAYMGDS